MKKSRRELQSRVEDAASCVGEGTELVSVWIPESKNIDTVRGRLRGERAESENIQSKQTRDRVATALEKVLNNLHKYQSTPENGMVLCAGYVPAVDEYVTFVFDDLPEPIRDSNYTCSDCFELQPLWEMAFGGSEWWGLATVTRDSASIGRYDNTESDYVDVIDCFESQVMGKSKAGGQSAQRFERVRQKQQEQHYKRVVGTIEQSFDVADDEFQGLAIGGPNVTISTFIEWLPSRFEEAIVTIENVDHAGSKESLVALAEDAESAFAEQEKQHERELVDRFKRRLRDSDRVAYGPEEVDRAIELGAVDTLLLSADLSTDHITTMTERVENKGGTVEIISTVHEQGRQLDSVFLGEAALLRFDIN